MAQTQVAVGAQALVFAAPDENGQLWHLTDALSRSAQVLIFQDFADRPGDAELLDALTETDLTKGINDGAR